MTRSQRKIDLSPSSTGVSLKTVRHRCHRCQELFDYHYDVFYDRAQLAPVDFICRHCFADYVLQEEARRLRTA